MNPGCCLQGLGRVPECPFRHVPGIDNEDRVDCGKEPSMARASQPPVAVRTYYRPIEAAIRWCGLLRFEKRILSALAGRPLPDEDEFRRWPTLRLNAERILDARAHDELPRRIAGRADAPQ